MQNPELLLLLENETEKKVSTRAARLKTKELKLFSQSLSRLLEGGIPVLRALECLEQTCKNRRLENFLKQTKDDVRQGAGFSNAIENAQAAPEYFSQIVYAGEVSGTMAHVLAELGGYLEKEETLKAKVREALAYPALILLMGAVTLGVLLQVVIPKLATVYQDFGAELPGITKIILTLSHLFLPAAALFCAGLTALIFLAFKKKETFNALLYRLPVAGSFLKACVLIQFTRLLSLLLESGVSILEALSLTEKTFTSSLIKEDISKLRQKLEQGEGFSKGLDDIGWMDPLSKMLAASGEESGRLPAFLAQIARDGQAQLESRIQMAVKLLEPGMILVIGLVVGFIVIGTVLPIFDISGLMR